MRVFTSIEPGCDRKSMIDTALAVHGRLLDLRRIPRSLCEVGLDEEDYQWMLRWGELLEVRAINMWLSSRPYKEGKSTPMNAVLGLLLLLLAAEVTRRESQEGTVWPKLRECFLDQTCQRLFAHDQPNEDMKGALKAATGAFHLRHAFGAADSQKYYRTVFFQFGFTKQGIARLPWWLAGHGVPEAIEELRYGSQRSVSFIRLWHALLDFRQHRINLDQVRGEINSSHWVLPSWADAIIEGAQARSDLVMIADNPNLAEGEGLLDEALLCWDGVDRPLFALRIVLARLPAFHESRYGVRINGKPMMTLLRRSDGSYSESAEPRVGLETPDIVVEFVAPNQETAAQEYLKLWDPGADVIVWDLQTGSRLDDPYTDVMSQRKTYALLTADDLHIDPTPSQWTRVGSGTHCLSYLPVGWSTDLRVLLDGQHLWSPNIHQPAEEPDWAKAIQIQASVGTVHIGDAVRMTVSGIAADVDLRFLRLGTTMPKFVPRGSRADLAPIKVTADLAIFGGKVTLGLAKGKTMFRSQRDLPFRILGAVRRVGQIWEHIDSEKPITKAEVTAFPIKLCVPEAARQNNGSHHLTIMEGATTRRSVPRRPASLTGLAGYGDSLTLHRGPYDSEECLIKIARSVIDPGIVKSSQIQADGTIIIDLRQEGYEPSSAHVVIIWQEGFNPQVVPGSAFTRVGAFQWHLRIKIFHGIDTAVGIGYEGRRIGAHWPARGSNMLGTIPGGPLRGDPVTAAALARWLHLPLLAAGYLQPARQLIDVAPLRTLGAWLGGAGLPSGLVHEPIDDAWRSVVRRLSWDWRPNAVQANELCKSLAADWEGDSCIGAAPVLTAINPILLGTVLLAHFADAATVYGSQERACLQNMQIELLRPVMSGGNGGTSNEWRMREMMVLGYNSPFPEDDLTQSAVATLKGGSLTIRQRLNLRVALQTEAYRQYLAGRVIGEVLRQLEERK